MARRTRKTTAATPQASASTPQASTPGNASAQDSPSMLTATPSNTRLVGRFGSASDQAGNVSGGRGSSDNRKSEGEAPKGTRIGVSAFAMPIYIQENSLTQWLIPSSDERIGLPSTCEFVDWLDVLPMYANHQAASEILCVHPKIQKFLHNKFPKLGLREVPKARVREYTLFELGLSPLMISGESRPDSVGVTKKCQLPVVLGEFKGSAHSPQVAISQSFAYMTAAALALEARGIPWKDVLVGGFVCNGLECQFMCSYMIAEMYPAVAVTSHVIDLSSRMGVYLAIAYFKKLEQLVERVNKREAREKWEPPNQAQIETQLKASNSQNQTAKTFTLESKSIHVRVGALHMPHFKKDLDAALRYNLHIFKKLRRLQRVVHHPVGMVTGMMAENNNSNTNIHLLYRDLMQDGFKQGLPKYDFSKPYIVALEAAIESVHECGVIHAKLNPLKCFWKLGSDSKSVEVKIVGWDLAWFAECGLPKYFEEEREDDPRVKACLNFSGGEGADEEAKKRAMDTCVIDRLRELRKEEWQKLSDENAKFHELFNQSKVPRNLELDFAGLSHEDHPK